MITTLEAVKLFMGLLDDSEDFVISPLHSAVEAWCKLACKKDFESATYAELHDGNGKTYLYLKHKPITVITQLSIGRADAIKVKNTATDSTYAYATIDSTKVTLVVLGGTSAGTDEVDYATYTTLTAIVDQINTLGDGWVATLADSDLASILATQLIECMARYCGGRGNTVASDIYLEIPGTPASNFRYNAKAGQLYLPSGFLKGYQNVYIGYTAGYSSTTMPADLQSSIEIGVKHLYDKRSEDGFGVENIRSGHQSQKYVELLPAEVLKVWDNHGRKRVVI